MTDPTRYHVLMDDGYDGLSLAGDLRIDQLKAMLTGGRDANDVGYDRQPPENLTVIEGRILADDELRALSAPDPDAARAGVQAASPGKKILEDPQAWMGGPIGAVAQGAYTTGPHPSLDVLIGHLHDWDVAHGKTAAGQLVFQGRMTDGNILPLDQPSSDYLKSRHAAANVSQVSQVRDLPDGLDKTGAWLQLDKDEAAALFRLLDRKPGLLGSIGAKLGLCLTDVGHDEAFRAAAREKYVGHLDDGDLDFQDDAMVSSSNDGSYVMAFLWVTNEEAGLEVNLEEEPEDEDPTP